MNQSPDFALIFLRTRRDSSGLCNPTLENATQLAVTASRLSPQSTSTAWAVVQSQAVKMGDFDSKPEALIPAFKLDRVLNQGISNSCLSAPSLTSPLTPCRPSRPPHSTLRLNLKLPRNLNPRARTLPNLAHLPLPGPFHPQYAQKSRCKRCLLLVHGNQRTPTFLNRRGVSRSKDQFDLSVYGNARQEIQQAGRANGHRNALHLRKADPTIHGG